MRHIHIAEGLRLKFPARCEEFDQGVEIGVIATLMEFGLRDFARRISPASIPQARALAERMGYRMFEGSPEGEAGPAGLTEMVFRLGQARPQLRLVHAAERDSTAPTASSPPSPPIRRMAVIGP